MCITADNDADVVLGIKLIVENKRMDRAVFLILRGLLAMYRTQYQPVCRESVVNCSRRDFEQFFCHYLSQVISEASRLVRKDRVKLGEAYVNLAGLFVKTR